MKKLFAPWRWPFISNPRREKGCVFCDACHSGGSDGLVCHRGKRAYVILNKYPYNNGHLMVIPEVHIPDLLSLPPDVSREVWELVGKSVDVLKSVFHPDGFNVGMNIGQAAGAGIRNHIHMHIVPRWKGDANFMAVIGGTDVQSFDMKEIQRIVKREFQKKYPGK